MQNMLLLKQAVPSWIANRLLPAKLGLCSAACVLVLLSMLLLATSCGQGGFGRPFREGIIEYSITYNDTIPPTFDPSLRPDRMVVKFSDHNTSNRIEGLSGAITFSLITNSEAKKSITLIKLLNKKLSYSEPLVEGQIPKAYANMPSMRFQFLDETEEFLGYTCKKALAWFCASQTEPFEILYTNEIDIKHPNKHTPFEPIDGVLLRFQMKMYNQHMLLEAQSARRSRVPDEEFEIPIEYEPVTFSTIEDVISLLQ